MNLTVNNYLTVLSIIIALGGGIFAVIQWFSFKKLRRAEFIDKIINTIRFDKDMPQIIYIIEYEYNWYNDDFHNNKNRDFQYRIDKLLSYIDYVCYLFNSENISDEEFKVLQYIITAICVSPDVQAYLWNLYHYSKKKMNIDCSFINLVNYGIKNRLVKDKFKENDKDLYINLYQKWDNAGIPGTPGGRI